MTCVAQAKLKSPDACEQPRDAHYSPLYGSIVPELSACCKSFRSSASAKNLLRRASCRRRSSTVFPWSDRTRGAKLAK